MVSPHLSGGIDAAARNFCAPSKIESTRNFAHHLRIACARMRSSFVIRSVLPTLQMYKRHTTISKATETSTMPAPANVSTAMFGSVG